MTNFIDLNDFCLTDVSDLVYDALKIKENVAEFSNKMNGKILGSLFFEPSTRTQFSFQSAMLRLGGNFLGFSDPSVSSILKGESFSDTIRMVSANSDLIVIRHKRDGAARAASFYSSCPIINAGDGTHLHPTQTLTDLLTLKQLKNGFSNLTIGFCGDLKFGRTVNSLAMALSCFKGNKFVFISTKELKISSFLADFLRKNGCSFCERNSLEEAIPELDVLYLTRVQRERFTKTDDYEKQKGRFKLTLNTLNSAKSNLVVLHPLPRVDEIDYEVDNDSRAAYFLQASNGIYARMALLLKLLSAKGFQSDFSKANQQGRKLNKVCGNANCIAHFEHDLPKLFVEKEGGFSCIYCDCTEQTEAH